MLPNYSAERLIRTELSTLFGLMMRKEVNFSHPGAHVIQTYIDRSNALLSELHESLVRPIREEFASMVHSPSTPNPADRGSFLREAIFYGAESAYVFQYLDLSRLKYRADETWLINNKGFSIDAACDIAKAIFDIQEDRVLSNGRELVSKGDIWSALPGFGFTASEISKLTNRDTTTVEAVLSAFSMDTHERNVSFTALKEYNVVNAIPLLQDAGGNFFAFHSMSLAEALYESPFYWMLKDNRYLALVRAVS
jgi:hypothetical protein